MKKNQCNENVLNFLLSVFICVYLWIRFSFLAEISCTQAREDG